MTSRPSPPCRRACWTSASCASRRRRRTSSTVRFRSTTNGGLYLRRDHPLAQKQAIAPQDLYEEQVILSRQLLCDHVFAHWLGKDPEELDIRATYNLVYNAAFLVEQRLGLLLSFKGLVPIEGPEHPDLTFRPFAPAFSSHNYLIWKKEQVFSRAAAIVRARLEEVFGSHD